MRGHLTPDAAATAYGERSWYEDLRACRTPLFWGGGLFAIGAVALILFSDPAFFYPRMRNDQLNYYLMSAQLAAKQTWLVAVAENASPISYVRLPSLLRAPIFLLFSDFDARIRAIQISNVALMLALGGIQGLFLYRFLPPMRWRSWLVAVPFLYLGLEASWQRNLLLPLSDIFFALFSFVAIFAFRAVVWQPPIGRRSVMLFCVGVAAALISFGIKFLGAFLFIYPLAMSPWRSANFWRDKSVRVLFLTFAALFLVSVIAAWPLLESYYEAGVLLLTRPEYHGSVADWVVSFFFASLPSQIIPNFSYLYASSFQEPAQFIDANYFNAGKTWLLIFGALISAAVGFGAYLARRRNKPEILYVLACLVVVAPITTGTARYLTYLQPMFFVFFIHTMREIWVRLPNLRRSAALAFFLSCVIAVVVTSFRYVRIESRDAADGLARLNGYLRYEQDVAGVYRRFRNRIAELPKDHSRLLPGYSVGAWKAVDNVEYYIPDGNLGGRMREIDLYLALDCERKYCGPVTAAEANLLSELRRYAPVCLKNIYTDVTPFAEARLYKVVSKRNNSC